MNEQVSLKRFRSWFRRSWRKLVSPIGRGYQHNTSGNVRMENATLPSEQDVKSQASRIYDALDARGYGIIKRQAVAEALPDNRVSMQLVSRLISA